MSFKGIVTRKDQDTGVTLLAKIVSPNKKKSTKKTFPVKVKSNGLDDYSCCVIDHSTVVSRLNSQGLNDLITNLSLLYNGVNGTRVSYSITDQGSIKLSSYLQSDGKLSGKPKYGENDAVGQLVITVTKGDAIVTSSVQITVKAISAYEVLNDASITKSSVWASIRGNNGYISDAINNDGPSNIKSQLNFVNSYPCSTLSVTPLTLKYNVVDRAIAAATSGGFVSDTTLGTSRIGENGAVVILSYKSSYDMSRALRNTGITAERVYGGNENNAKYFYYRIGGITLTITASLGDEERVFTYECAIQNNFIGNQEIVDAITEPDEENNILIQAFKVSDGSSMDYNLESDIIITAPAEGGTESIRTLSNTGSELLTVSSLGLGMSQVTDITISSTLLEHGTSYEIRNTNPEVYRDVFGGGFSPDGDSSDGSTMRFEVLTIDFDAMKAAYDAGNNGVLKFAIKTDVSTDKYQGGGGLSNNDITLKIAVNIDAMGTQATSIDEDEPIVDEPIVDETNNTEE